MPEHEIEALFRQWWQQSYPTPPGPHALITHIGWGRYLLELIQQQQQQERQR